MWEAGARRTLWVAVTAGRCCHPRSPPGWSPRASAAGERGWGLASAEAGGAPSPLPAPTGACRHLLAVQGVRDPRGLQLRRQEQLQPDGGARGLLPLDEQRDLLGLPGPGWLSARPAPPVSTLRGRPLLTPASRLASPACGCSAAAGRGLARGPPLP